MDAAPNYATDNAGGGTLVMEDYYHGTGDSQDLPHICM